MSKCRLAVRPVLRLKPLNPARRCASTSPRCARRSRKGSRWQSTRTGEPAPGGGFCPIGLLDLVVTTFFKCQYTHMNCNPFMTASSAHQLFEVPEVILSSGQSQCFREARERILLSRGGARSAGPSLQRQSSGGSAKWGNRVPCHAIRALTEVAQTIELADKIQQQRLGCKD